MHEVDELDPLARRVGAINTLVDPGWALVRGEYRRRRLPRRRWPGRIAAARHPRIDPRRRRRRPRGGGGACRQGRTVAVSARRTDAAREIADLAGGTRRRVPASQAAAGMCWSTPPRRAAMPRSTSPIAGAPLDGELVSTSFTSRPTPGCCSDARAAGCVTIGGLDMLVAQAERQFELWTGQRAACRPLPTQRERRRPVRTT